MDGWISRSGVDVIMDIKYHKHYPVLLLMLPSGLSIYNAKLLSAYGNLAVLSSTHAAWVCDHAQAQLSVRGRLYLSSKARAWYVEQNWAEINSSKLGQLEMFTKDESEGTCKEKAAVRDGPARGWAKLLFI